MPKEPRKLKRTPFYRFGGILIVALFAAWNWVNPARIAPTTEAVFTWSFYAFQVLTVLWIIAGYWAHVITPSTLKIEWFRFRQHSPFCTVCVA